MYKMAQAKKNPPDKHSQDQLQGYITLSSERDQTLDRTEISVNNSSDGPTLVSVPYELRDGSAMSFCFDAPAEVRRDQCIIAVGITATPKWPTTSTLLYGNGSTSANSAEVKSQRLAFSAIHKMQRVGNKVIITTSDQPVTFDVRQRVYPVVSLQGPPGLTVSVKMSLCFKTDMNDMTRKIQRDVNDIYESIDMLDMEESKIDSSQVFPPKIALFGTAGCGKSAAVNTFVNAFTRHFAKGGAKPNAMGRANEFPARSGLTHLTHQSLTHRTHDLAKQGAIALLDLRSPPCAVLDTFGCPLDDSLWMPFFASMSLLLKGTLDPRVDATNYHTFSDQLEMEHIPPSFPQLRDFPAVALILINGRAVANGTASAEGQYRFLKRALQTILGVTTIPRHNSDHIANVPPRRPVVVITHAEALDIRLKYEDVSPGDYSAAYRECVNRITETSLPDTEILPLINYSKGVDHKGTIIRDRHAVRVMKACVESAMEWYGDLVDSHGGQELLRAAALST